MICTECNEDKGTDFRKSRKVCRECDNAAQRERNKKAKEQEKPKSIKCNKCGKRTSDFRINRQTCLDCERAHGRKYRRETTKSKEWTENNKEQMAKLQREWQKKEKKDNPLYKTATTHRTILCQWVKNPKAKTSKYVNCTRSQFIHWLMFLMTDDMTLENYATVWEIDHVIPIQQYTRGHEPEAVVLTWMNVRPCLCKDNGRKSKNIDVDECLQHLENLNAYITHKKIKEDSEYITAVQRICDNAKHLVAGIPLEP